MRHAVLLLASMLFLSVGAVSVGAASARAEELQLVPHANNAVEFKAHTTFHDFVGRSTQVSAQFSLNGGRLERASVAVPVASIHTGNDKRDRDMRAEKYLDADHHPQIIFSATTFTGPPIVRVQNGAGELQGTLTVRGQAKPVSVPVRYQWSGGSCLVTGTFPVDLRTYGMSPPTVFLIQRMDATVVVSFTLTFASKGTTS